jgi:hypothetical protein
MPRLRCDEKVMESLGMAGQLTKNGQHGPSKSYGTKTTAIVVIIIISIIIIIIIFTYIYYYF